MKNQKMLIVVIVVIACFLTACNFTTNFSDGLGVTKMEAYSQVEEMMTAFSNNDKQAGLALMHPDYVSKFEAAYEQLVVFLNGRKVSKMTQNSVNVKTSSGTGGSVRQETGSLLVTLEDGTEFYLSVCHVRESGKEGFISFQFVLGVI